MWNYDYDQLCNDELYHWGKKGMRWGHRNKKSSSGYEKVNAKWRVVDDDEPSGSSSKEKRKYKAPNQKQLNATQNALNSSVSGVNSARQVNRTVYDRKASSEKQKRTMVSKKQASKMTDQELRDQVNRMNMEKQYASLKEEDVDVGRNNVEDALAIAGGVLAVGASAVGIAVGIQQLRGKM